MFQGDSKELVITVTDDDGNFTDLSGATATWKLFRTYTTPPLVQKSTADGGITISDPLSGQFTVNLVESDTNNIHGQYFHEARLEDLRGYVTIVTVGKVMIHPRNTL